MKKIPSDLLSQHPPAPLKAHHQNWHANGSLEDVAKPMSTALLDLDVKLKRHFEHRP